MVYCNTIKFDNKEMKKMIDILMAAYNGDRFISEQIESILAQSVNGWHLYIRDDGSSDRSFQIALEYSGKYPKLITAERSSIPTGSACANFMGMLKHSEAEYVMFCDQDDFWYPDKIKLTYEKMLELEEKYPDVPILVHTELEIADRELNVINNSFTKFQGLDPKCSSLNRLLCQNNITGCTVMMNKALADIIKGASPEEMLMHDWWAGLAAASFGHIGFVDTPTIKYRQHGDNQVGAVNNRSVAGTVNILNNRQRAKERIYMTYRQSKSFYEYYKPFLNEKARHILETYNRISDSSKPIRIIKLIENGFLKQNFMAAVGQLIFC